MMVWLGSLELDSGCDVAQTDPLTPQSDVTNNTGFSNTSTRVLACDTPKCDRPLRIFGSAAVLGVMRWNRVVVPYLSSRVTRLLSNGFHPVNNQQISSFLWLIIGKK